MVCGSFDSPQWRKYDWITDLFLLNKSFVPPYKDRLAVPWPTEDGALVESLCYLEKEDLVVAFGVQALVSPSELSNLKKPEGPRGNLMIWRYFPKTGRIDSHVTEFLVDGFASRIEPGVRTPTGEMTVYERKGGDPGIYLSQEYRYNYGSDVVTHVRSCTTTKTQDQLELSYNAYFGEGIECLNRLKPMEDPKESLKNSSRK